MSNKGFAGSHYNIIISFRPVHNTYVDCEKSLLWPILMFCIRHNPIQIKMTAKEEVRWHSLKRYKAYMRAGQVGHTDTRLSPRRTTEHALTTVATHGKLWTFSLISVAIAFLRLASIQSRLQRCQNGTPMGSSFSPRWGVMSKQWRAIGERPDL